VSSHYTDSTAGTTPVGSNGSSLGQLITSRLMNNHKGHRSPVLDLVRGLNRITRSRSCLL
jgi:hypothetical protein